MKKVLVAVDGSDKSLEAADYAMSIANKEGAQLIILNVLDTEPWLYGQSAYFSDISTGTMWLLKPVLYRLC